MKLYFGVKLSPGLKPVEEHARYVGAEAPTSYRETCSRSFEGRDVALRRGAWARWLDGSRRCGRGGGGHAGCGVGSADLVAYASDCADQGAVVAAVHFSA